MVDKTKFFSNKVKSLPVGCKLCVEGKKTVVFITGICPKNCFYCPLSENKKNKDTVYVNERKIKSNDLISLISEAKSHGSKGAGITGGDPLSKINRTVKFIKALKSHYGPRYHIHLYTSPILATKEKLDKLFQAGLDEIRFHPDLFDKEYWHRIELASNFKWDIGLEIPIIPDQYKETKELIEYVKNKVHFINLNELEYSDNQPKSLKSLGYVTIDPTTYAIKKSKSTGLRLLKHIESKTKLKAHLCTAKLKDTVQLKNRLLRRAKFTKLPVDYVTLEGTLVRGCIYPIISSPRNKTATQLKAVKITRLKFNKNFQDLKSIFKSKIYSDYEQLRYIVNPDDLDKKVKKIPKEFDCAVVEEYPTYDSMKVEIDFLN